MGERGQRNKRVKSKKVEAKETTKQDTATEQCKHNRIG